MDFLVNFIEALPRLMLGAWDVLFVLCPALVIAMNLICIVVMWRLFEKAGYKSWKAFIPFYNIWCMFEIVYGKGYGSRSLLLLLPLANFALPFDLCLLVADILGRRAFGLKTWFGMILLPAVLYMLLLPFANLVYLILLFIRVADVFGRRGLSLKGVC